MPRTSRAVAQRLATQKTRKRRPRSTAEGISPAVEQVLDRAAPDEGETATPALSSRSGRTRLTEPTARAVVVRRSYAEYGSEYSYVWADLRRIVLVGGSLLLLLIALSFVIR